MGKGNESDLHVTDASVGIWSRSVGWHTTNATADTPPMLRPTHHQHIGWHTIDSQPTWDWTIIAICGQINSLRRLQTHRIALSEFPSFSLPCPLPRSHAAVLSILLIWLWKLTVCRKQRWSFLESEANIHPKDAYPLYKSGHFDWSF